MTIKNQNYQEEFQERLKRQLHEHRRNLKLSQIEVAQAVGKTPDTYQRWESSGQHLTDIFSLLSIFQVLHFSTTEIIDVLGLPPLTLGEIKAIYQDEDTLKNIKENGIYPAVRERCPDMDDVTLGKLLAFFLSEYLKRLEKRQK